MPGSYDISFPDDFKRERLGKQAPSSPYPKP
jgi:hypothetical protein